MAIALLKKKRQARKLRKQGLPYSAIKEELGVSKSSLSLWLRDIPLSKDKINALRANSPKRIERFRLTMQGKKNLRLSGVLNKVKNNIGKLSKREILIGGMFLYWGEGGKTQPYRITLTNTDPGMIKFYMEWLNLLGVSKNEVKIRLHLYSDMDILKEINFWMKITGVPRESFQKSYVKKSRREYVDQKGFSHGTCNVIVGDRDISEYVLTAVRYLASITK